MHFNTKNYLKSNHNYTVKQHRSMLPPQLSLRQNNTIDSLKKPRTT
jgi:hypothetical protein